MHLLNMDNADAVWSLKIRINYYNSNLLCIIMGNTLKDKVAFSLFWSGTYESTVGCINNAYSKKTRQQNNANIMSI